MHKTVEHRGHDEVGDTTSGISQASREGIGSADNVLVVEARCPYLARNKATSVDTDEETASVKLTGVVHSTSEEGGDGTNEEASSESISRADPVASWARDQTHQKCSSQADDVGVQHYRIRNLEVGFDHVTEQRRKSIPES